jgi:hypothetical protein
MGNSRGCGKSAGLATGQSMQAFFRPAWPRCGRLEAEVSNDRRRHVHQDAFAANLVSPDVTIDDPPDPEEAPPFTPVDKRRLELADQDVLEIGQHAAGLEQAIVRLENLPDLRHGETIERQAGNDVIVNSFAFQVFDGVMNHPRLPAPSAKQGVQIEAALEHGDEMAVQLDGVQMIFGVKVPKDLCGDRPGARPDFEDAAGGAWLAKFVNQGAGEKLAAGQEGASIPPVTPKLAEESFAFRPESHPGAS